MSPHAPEKYAGPERAPEHVASPSMSHFSGSAEGHPGGNFERGQGSKSRIGWPSNDPKPETFSGENEHMGSREPDVAKPPWRRKKVQISAYCNFVPIRVARNLGKPTQTFANSTCVEILSPPTLKVTISSLEVSTML